jgi:ABC-type branched-subunit amino acid transport system substrate-binding protein
VARRTQRVTILSLAAAVTLVAAACSSSSSSSSSSSAGGSSSSSSSKSPISVGLLLGLSSALSASVKSIEQGIIYEIKQVNAAGGINGRQIKYYVLDDAGTTTGTTSAFLQLVTADHVTALLGVADNTQLVAMADEMVARHLYVPELGLAGPENLPAGSPAFNWVYGAGINVEDVAKQQIDFLVQHAGVKKVGVIYSSDEFGQGSLATVTAEAKTLGVTITSSQPLSLTATDLLAPMTKLKNSGAQGTMTFFDAIPGTIQGFLQARANLGWTPPTSFWDVYLGSAGLNISNPLLKNAYVSGFCNTSTPAYQQFVQGTAAQMNFAGATVTQGAAAYVATQVLFHAMKSVNDPTNPTQVNNAIQTQTQNFPSLCGSGSVTLSTTNHSFNLLVPIYSYINGQTSYLVP